MFLEQETDVLIAGGGLGGCAAALALARAGYKGVLTEETDWIGGQLTTQAVPPDEHGWIERFGCTAAYRQFRDGIRRYYRNHYPLTDVARKQTNLNPGNGWVSPLCHEPRVALAVLEGMLAPYVSSGRLQILREHRPVSVEQARDDRISAVTFRSRNSGDEKIISAKYVLDATELGDLLPLAGVEFITGSESQTQTGEPGAAAEANCEQHASYVGLFCRRPSPRGRSYDQTARAICLLAGLHTATHTTLAGQTARLERLPSPHNANRAIQFQSAYRACMGIFRTMVLSTHYCPR